VTAAVLVAAALAALIVVLTDPYTRADSNIPYTLMAAVLGAAAFFAGLALAERTWLLGMAVAVAALGGLWSLVFAIWIGAIVESQATGLVSAGGLTLVTAAYDIFFTFMAAVFTASALLGGLLAIERGALLLGWTALAVAPPALGLVSYGIWADTPDQLLQIWAGAVITAALLVALTARLFARGTGLTRLAAASGVLAGAAAIVGIWDVWSENVELRLFERATTALWIVAVLCCLLVPVLEHYRARDVDPQASGAGA
jgi:hypothetical protein